MRVFLIVAVFVALDHPAAASLFDTFDDTECMDLKRSSYTSYKYAAEVLSSAVDLQPTKTESQQESYEMLLNHSDQLMAEASHKATIYLAFCKD